MMVRMLKVCCGSAPAIAKNNKTSAVEPETENEPESVSEITQNHVLNYGDNVEELAGLDQIVVKVIQNVLKNLLHIINAYLNLIITN